MDETLTGVIRIAVAILGGAAVGVERQRSGHATGPDARFGAWRGGRWAMRISRRSVTLTFARLSQAQSRKLVGARHRRNCRQHRDVRARRDRSGGA